MSRILFLTTLALSCSGPQGDLPRSDDLLKLIAGLHQGYRDVSFSYEGQFRFNPAIAEKAKVQPDQFGEDYEGDYVWIAGKVVYQDVFRRGTNEMHRIARETHTIQGGQSLRTESYADSPGLKIPEEKGQDHPLLLTETSCAQRYLFLYFFQQLALGPPEQLEVLGWDQVDGRRVLKTRYHVSPKRDAKLPSFLIWIDMERGGHVLRVERFMNGRVLYRTHDIVLREIPGEDGKAHWLPVSGVTDTYLWNNVYYDDYVTRDTFHMVRDTVLVNSGRPLEKLRTEKDRARGPARAHLDLEKAFEEQSKAAQKPRRAQTHPSQIEEQLKAKLAVAEGQSRALDASRPVSGEGLQTIFAQVGLTLLGLGVLITAWVLRKR